MCFLFFFNDTATTEIYTLSLHDALPIYDEDFTLVFVKEKLARGFGKRRIYLDLIKLGIEPELIEDKLNSIDEQTYIEKIQEVAGRRQARYRNSENRQAKVFRYLRQRGFSIDEINKAFNENR